MIQFPCHCSYHFQLPDDMAGVMVQCPKCGRLNDVPTLNDLQSLESDGTIKMDESPVVPEPERLNEARRVYSPNRIDEYGREIDLRGSAGPIEEDTGVFGVEEEKPSPPRYDPYTGELIKPVEVKPVDPLENVRPPLPPGAQIRRPSKRWAFERLDRVRPLAILAYLFRPANLFVMVTILLAHVFFQFCRVVALGGMFIVIPGWAVAFFAIIGHYGNVIDETGPASHDELPRLLRNVSLYDDVLQPSIMIFLTYFVCFGPACGFFFSPVDPASLRIAGSVVLGFLGLCFAPAVLLTATTSGNIVNMRPDRVIGVIRSCGSHYVVMVTAFALAAFCYWFAWKAFNDSASAIFHASSMPRPWWAYFWISVPALIGAIYLAHYCAWLLGQTYRVYQPLFPWEFQGRRSDEAERGPVGTRAFEVVPVAKSSKPLPINKK